MTFVHEVFTVVLLIAPAEPAAARALTLDAFLIPTSNERRTQPRPVLYAGPAVYARGHAAKFFTPFECSRFMWPAETRDISASIHIAGETGSTRLLLPLKDALRLVTGYVGAVPHGHRQVPTAIVMTGIRG